MGLVVLNRFKHSSELRDYLYKVLSGRFNWLLTSNVRQKITFRMKSLRQMDVDELLVLFAVWLMTVCYCFGTLLYAVQQCQVWTILSTMQHQLISRVTNGVVRQRKYAGGHVEYSFIHCVYDWYCFVHVRRASRLLDTSYAWLTMTCRQSSAFWPCLFIN